MYTYMRKGKAKAFCFKLLLLLMNWDLTMFRTWLSIYILSMPKFLQIHKYCIFFYFVGSVCAHPRWFAEREPFYFTYIYVLVLDNNAAMESSVWYTIIVSHVVETRMDGTSCPFEHHATSLVLFICILLFHSPI